MNYKLISGVALVAATLTYIGTLGASPGDAIYAQKLRDPPVTLSAGQKTALAPLVTAAWADSTPADIQSIRCWQARKGWTCNGIEAPTISDADYLARRIAGKQSGANRRLGGVLLGTAAQANVSTWTTDVFGNALASLYMFECKRDTEDPFTDILCSDSLIVTASPAAFRASDGNGEVMKVLGQVE